MTSTSQKFSHGSLTTTILLVATFSHRRTLGLPISSVSDCIAEELLISTADVSSWLTSETIEHIMENRSKHESSRARKESLQTSSNLDHMSFFRTPSVQNSVAKFHGAHRQVQTLPSATVASSPDNTWPSHMKSAQQPVMDDAPVSCVESNSSDSWSPSYTLISSSNSSAILMNCSKQAFPRLIPLTDVRPSANDKESRQAIINSRSSSQTPAATSSTSRPMWTTRKLCNWQLRLHPSSARLPTLILILANGTSLALTQMAVLVNHPKTRKPELGPLGQKAKVPMLFTPLMRRRWLSLNRRPMRPSKSFTMRSDKMRHSLGTPSTPCI